MRLHTRTHASAHTHTHPVSRAKAKGSRGAGRSWQLLGWLTCDFPLFMALLARG